MVSANDNSSVNSSNIGIYPTISSVPPTHEQSEKSENLGNANPFLQPPSSTVQGSQELDSSSNSLMSNSFTSLVTTKHYEYPDRKGWKGLSSLEKSLSISLAITSTIAVGLMIAVVVVGVQSRNKESEVIIVDRTVNPSTTPSSGSDGTSPVDRCSTTTRPRPLRRSTTTDPTTGSSDDYYDSSTTTEVTENDPLLSPSISQWIPNADCIISDKNNSTICLAPQCFRMASRIIDSIDFSADPCQDFYKFSCGNWVKNHPIPEYSQTWNQHNLLESRLLREVKDILEMDHSMNDSTSLQLAKKFYHSCIHLPDDEVNVAEMRLLLEEMSSADDQLNPTELTVIMSHVRRALNGNYILALNIDVNDENTTENVIYLSQPVLGLQSLIKEMDISLPSDMIKNIYEETGNLQIRQVYQNLIEKLWTFLYPEEERNGKKVLADIFSFEKNLSRILVDFEEFEHKGPPTLLNLREADEAEISLSMISWLSEYVDNVLQMNHEANQSNERPAVILKNIEYFKELEILLNETDVTVIENYIKIRILLGFGLHGSQAFRKMFEEFKQSVMNNEFPVPRWKTCSRLTNDFFGWTISQKFLTIFDEITKSQLNLTVGYLKDVFNEHLNGSEWISNNTTKQYAESKIKHLQTFLGFPDWWQDAAATPQNSANSFVESFYSDMNLTDANNYFQNYIEATMWASRKHLAEIHQPTLRESMSGWPKLIYPTTMHAYHSQNQNYLVIPAGMIDHSMTLMDSTFPSLHYGNLGITIAKEMLSAIIENGKFRQIDDSIGNWWDNETVSNFENISNCFKDQLPENGRNDLHHLQSILTTGSLSLAYKAYSSQSFDREFDEVLLPGLQDFSPEQLFFLSFAQSQCSHEVKPLIEETFRKAIFENGLHNSVYFAKHWNCPLPHQESVCRVL